MKSEILSKKAWNYNVLILGKGYIGQNVAHSLGVYNTHLKSSDDLNYHDIKVLSRFLLNNDIDLVINCSGFTGRPNVDEGEIKKELCWKLNVESPLCINRLCNGLGVRYVHISSGCIYDTYDKIYTEESNPNFGLFNVSSFYSKSKHAFETLSRCFDNKIIRIRMPITPYETQRNYLTKIKNYDNIIDKLNSKTYIPDLCNFIHNLLKHNTIGFWNGQDIYNVVNPNPLDTRTIISKMKEFGYDNPNWKFVDLKDLDIKAPRSNCVLDNTKSNIIYQMRDELEIINEALTNITHARQV